MSKHNNPTLDPTKFDLNRSMESLLESFPSGEMTNMMDIKVQNNWYSGSLMYKE